MTIESEKVELTLGNTDFICEVKFEYTKGYPQTQTEPEEPAEYDIQSLTTELPHNSVFDLGDLLNIEEVYEHICEQLEEISKERFFDGY